MGKPWINLGEREYYIYRIFCKDANIKNCYVGHTNSFVSRKGQHKYNCHNDKRKHYNYKVYKMIRENGGWDNWNFEIIENIVCTRKEASEREQYWYNEFQANMNSCIPCCHKLI